MRYSRMGIVAMLIAAEAFIAGGIISQAAGIHPEHRTASDSHVFDAGAAPHVVVDDQDSRVIVTPSSDGRVHVTDLTHTLGFFWSNGPRRALEASRTPDGVAVRRPGTKPIHFAVLFGFERDRIEVAVPEGAFVDLQGCDGADVSGIKADSIAVNCQDGSLHVSDLDVRNGTLRTASGSIRLAIASSDVTVHAKTADGSLRFNGQRVHSDEDASEGTFQLGSGSGRLEVATQDGGIRISTNGANR